MATLLWLWAALAVLGGPLLAGAAKYNGPGGEAVCLMSTSMPDLSFVATEIEPQGTDLQFK